MGDPMTYLRLLPLAMLLASPLAFAQSGSCPELPAGTGMSWEKQEGPDFTYCKAMRDDGHQAFAVMLRPDAQFRTRRSHREGSEVLIDGHQVYWYRGDVPRGIVRETLLELDRNATAHIVVRAENEAELADSQRIAQGMRFRDGRLGSN
jgi:hypothetical protein